MWIVKLALRRPYTFVVASLVVLLMGILSIRSMSTDIFPNINIPVVTVVWRYGGLTPDDMAKRITTYSEYTISSAVADVRTIESQTLSGVSVIKVFLQQGANVDGAIAQLAAVSQSILRRMPPGTQPPVIVRYNASSVPILQLSLSSKTLPESALYDYGIYRVRQALAPIRGLTLPLPYGGKPRQIMVDLDPQALFSRGLSPNDVSAAINVQNLTLPSGTVKMGPREYIVSLNSSPDAVEALNDVPIRQVNGAMVYVRDVAHVRDGFAVQTNMVRQDGQKGALLTILKSGGASTLDIVKSVKAYLPDIRAAAPAGLEIKELFDQSRFVRAAVNGVLEEGAIAAFLTGFMILVFLGSWRSTLIVSLSIPLSPVEATRVNVAASAANVQRLLAETSFKKMVAPYSGIITARTVDRGALITAGSSSTSIPLFRMAQVDTLRIFVDVPQTFVRLIAPGQEARLVLREFSRRTFSGRVSRTAGALDPTSRTLRTEVLVRNGDGTLMPGMYAQVGFSVVEPDPPFLIPATALVIREEGPQVAVVREDHTAHYQKVELGRDLGATVEVTAGLKGDERLIVNIPDGLKQGSTVRPVGA